MNEPAFRALTSEELRALYDQDMPLQFPQDEIRPWTNIRHLLKEGCYGGWALLSEGRTLSYALCAKAGRSVLVDYLATPDPWKNRGYGSRLLERLRSVMTDTDRILIESEDPEVLSGKEAAMARRRLGFYARNGFAGTTVRVCLYGVEFRILSSESGPERDANARSGMEALYRTMLPAPLRALIVRFHD